MNANTQQHQQHQQQEESFEKYPCSENYTKNINKLDAHYRFYYLNEDDE